MKLLSIMLIILTFSMCSNKKKYIVEEGFIKDVVQNPFKDLEKNIEIKLIVKEKLSMIFSGKKYKIIKQFIIKGKNAYLAIEEISPDLIYRAVRSGVVIQEDGIIRERFDVNKGIYNQITGKMIIDFKKIGIKIGEISCFIFEKFEKEGFYIHILDKEYNKIIDPKIYSAASLSDFTLEINQAIKNPKADIKEDLFYIFQANERETLDKIYNLRKKHYEAYKKAKKEGKAVKSAALKSEFERLKKAGLVQE